MKRPLVRCSRCRRRVQFPINRLKMRTWWTCERCSEFVPIDQLPDEPVFCLSSIDRTVAMSDHEWRSDHE